MVWPEVNSCGKCAWRHWRRTVVDRNRECVGCGETRRITGRDLCGRCYQLDPQWPYRYAANIESRLPAVPDWLDDYVDHLTVRFSPHQSVVHLRALSVALKQAGSSRPSELYAVLGSASALALEEFLTTTGRGFARDLETGRAAARRRARIDAIDESIRIHIVAFEAAMLTRQDRARRIGARADTNQTIEARLTVLRDFFSHCQSRHGFVNIELVSIAHVESFLAASDAQHTAATSLAYLRQFFRWARRHKLVLVDPTAGIYRNSKPIFDGPVLGIDAQRVLFRRWTTATDLHPYEAAIGLLSLIHAVRRSDLVALKANDIADGSLSLQSRRGELKLDPATRRAVDTAVAHRRSLDTLNPHLFVSGFARTNSRPVTGMFLTEVVTSNGGPALRTLRATRLATLMDGADAIFVGNAVGLDPKNALYYLGDTSISIRVANGDE